MYDPLTKVRANISSGIQALQRAETELINYHLGRGSIPQVWEYAAQAGEWMRLLDQSIATLPDIYKQPKR